MTIPASSVMSCGFHSKIMVLLFLTVMNFGFAFGGHGTPIHLTKSSGAVAADGTRLPNSPFNAFSKVRHPNDIMANINGMAPTRIGMRRLS